METLITDANNLDFINLTKELDQSLHTIGFDQSEQDKSKYASFTVAIKFYSSIGYSKIDNFPPYIHMSDSFCMGKDLN